ncbi:MAG: L,D-transpeptidase [Byssovorax sp.]
MVTSLTALHDVARADDDLPAPGARPPHAPPWIDRSVPVLPAGIQSARVLLADQPVLSGPFGNAPRRGTIARDVHLPVFAARRGAGCGGSFLEVGPSAWVCDDAVELTARASIDAAARTFPESADGMPFRYFFVGPDGSFAYRRLESADLDEPQMQLQGGFAVAIVAEQASGGARYGKTAHDLWVPMRDLGPVRSFSFQGEVIAPTAAPQGAQGMLPVGWVIADRAHVYTRPNAGSIGPASKIRFETVPVLDEQRTGGLTFFRIGEDAWMSAKDLRHPTLADAPPEVDTDAGEKWIDVELATQTLVAYEGKRPVFATLVSTGKGKQGTALATPVGTHRIWIKLLLSDMDNLEDENAARYYRMESVPWVQYFSKGVGLHGAFWHRSFGQVRSHGCVNLTPIDAQRLFYWTGPHLPAGWTAVFPTRHEQGTVVRVR